ncbi:MAG TPA: Gfo/Idh/MocA family oxidoreductase [Bryobacteraceae bacterium]|nr:Gfo/Idh/MocA family oxidoreductase [Bryobacteraceae bacterium]
MRKIRWGVLGVAKIAVTKVIPAMQRCEWAEIVAIASRDLQKARATGLAKSYGSYEELIDDPEIDAVYIPLPNHLHVPWSLRAARAGKHVLCEKPIGLSAAEARQLLGFPVKIGEAFMARTHPQWVRVAELVRSGRIGELRVINGFFSYDNRDPQNVRNVAEWGGGALMDIGCYPVTLARMLFGEEPRRAVGSIERDPQFKTDRLTSAILEFSTGRCVFTCSTQLTPYQKMQMFGTRGMIEVEIPFNAPPDRPTRIFVDGIAEELPVCDQYTLQGDLFSRAILEDSAVPVPIEDAVKNMEAIEAIFAASKS